MCIYSSAFLATVHFPFSKLKCHQSNGKDTLPAQLIKLNEENCCEMKVWINYREIKILLKAL